MPLNKKGKKILAEMQKEYGKEKGKAVFYASENKGTIKGVKTSVKKLVHQDLNLNLLYLRSLIRVYYLVLKISS